MRVLQHLFDERSVLFIELIFELIAHGVDGRKLIAPLVGPGSVDDRARIEAFSLFGNGRIERTAPTAANDIDVFRLGARRQGPDDVVGVVDIDVVIDDDYISSQISSWAALACDQRRLFGVTGIALLVILMIEKKR